MKYLKVTRDGQFLGVEVLSVHDIHEASGGDCLLIDIERELFMTPATEGEWEPVTMVRLTQASHVVMQ